MPQQNQLPVIRSIFAPAALIPLLEQSYGLAISRLQLIKPVVLDTYRVSSGDGPYIFRIYPAQGRTLAEISCELDFLEFLHSRAIPVSIPITTNLGERTLPLQAPEGVRQAALFTYAPGKPLPADPEATYGYGRLLARMHAAADAFPDTGTRTPLDLRFLLDRPLSNLQTVAHREQDWSVLESIAGSVRSHIEALPKTAPYFGYCHGDFWRGNAHFDGGGEVTLFDFDFCGPGWRVYDVATFLDGESTEVAAAFLEGYQSVRLLGDRERRAIPLFQIAQKIWMLGTRASHLDEWGTMRLTDEFIDHVLDQIHNIWNTFRP